MEHTSVLRYVYFFCFLVSVYVGGVPVPLNSKRILINEHDYFESRFKEMEAQILNLTNQVQSLRSHEHVHQSFAFLALLDHDINLAPSQIVRYNSVVTNDGNAYDASTGIFEAPINGVYGISAGVMSSTTYIHLQLMLNGHELVRLWTHGSGQRELAAQTVYVHLKQHDRLWIQSIETSNLYGGEKFNIFSAALISKDE